MFKKSHFLRKSSPPGSEAARDKWLVQKNKSDSEKKFCPRQRSCPGQVACSKNKSFFEEKFCPRQRSGPGQVVCSKKVKKSRKKICPEQRSCPGQVACYKKKQLFMTSSAPGSEAAPDKWLGQKKTDFWEEVLPRTSGSGARKRTTAAAKGAERLLGGPGGLLSLLCSFALFASISGARL